MGWASSRGWGRCGACEESVKGLMLTVQGFILLVSVADEFKGTSETWIIMCDRITDIHAWRPVSGYK